MYTSASHISNIQNCVKRETETKIALAQTQYWIIEKRNKSLFVGKSWAASPRRLLVTLFLETALQHISCVWSQRGADIFLCFHCYKNFGITADKGITNSAGGGQLKWYNSTAPRPFHLYQRTCTVLNTCSPVSLPLCLSVISLSACWLHLGQPLL